MKPNDNNRVSNEVFAMFEKAIEGSLSQQDAERLDQLVRSDEAIRRAYLEYTHLHACLHWDGVSISDHDQRDFVNAIQHSEKESIATVTLFSNRWVDHFFRYASVAVVAVLLTAFSLSFVQSWGTPQAESNSDLNVEAMNRLDVTVARVVQRIDCVMQNEKWNLANPFAYESGQTVSVSEGLAVIQFNSGARVTLEGPADLEIVSANGGFLHNGKLTATVPEHAIGFEIGTPTSRVIDYGTEFGVSVSDEGDTETHVFDGEVHVVPDVVKMAGSRSGESANPATNDPATNDPATNDPVTNDPVTAVSSGNASTAGHRLTESMAMRVNAQRTTGEADSLPTQSIASRPQDFIRIVNPGSSSDENLAPVTELPQADRLIMWFEASKGVQLDADSRVVSWDNLAPSKSVGRPSASTSAAWQVDANHRPLWQPDLAESRPAIEFSGLLRNEYLVTTPIATSDDLSVLVVCRFLGVAPYGPFLALNTTNKVKLHLARDNVNPLYRAFSTTFNRGNVPPFQKIEVSVGSRPTQKWIVCGVRYSHQAGTFELYQNGMIEGTGEPLGSLAGESIHVIGSQKDCSHFFFQGNVAEMVVYDHMLDRDSFDVAMTSLMEKYQIDTVDSDANALD